MSDLSYLTLANFAEQEQEIADNIETTLTNRSDLSYLMLLGREGMGDRVLIDPSKTFLLINENKGNK